MCIRDRTYIVSGIITDLSTGADIKTAEVTLMLGSEELFISKNESEFSFNIASSKVTEDAQFILVLKPQVIRATLVRSSLRSVRV